MGLEMRLLRKTTGHCYTTVTGSTYSTLIYSNSHMYIWLFSFIAIESTQPFLPPLQATPPLHTKPDLFIFLLNNTDLNTLICHVSPPYSTNALIILLSFHCAPIRQSRHKSKRSIDLLALLLKTSESKVIAYLQKNHSSHRKCCHFKVC